MVWKWLTFGKAREALPNPARPQGGRADEAYRDIEQTDSPTLIGHAPKYKSTWALNQDEANYNPAASVVSFRTIGFRNLAHPDSPTEYLEADFLPDTQRWRLRQCTDGDGRALSAMFNRAAEGSTMQMAVHKSTTLVEKAAFMFVLQKMAVYEFGTDTASQYAMREVVEEDLGNSHFIQVAHAAGVIFDVNGHPSMTLNGRPMRDGQYPQSELNHAVAHYNANKPVSLSGLLGSAPLAQENAGLDSFEDFSKLLKFNHKLGVLMGDLKDLREHFCVTYDDEKGAFVLSDRWRKLTSSFIHVQFNSIVQKADEASGVLDGSENHKDVLGFLEGISVMLHVVNATTMMQCHHDKGEPPSRDPVNPIFVSAALANADAALSSCESFSDEQKKMIRGFIMGHHSVEETLVMFDSIIANVQSIVDAAQHAEKASIQQSQVKIEVIPSYYEIPMPEENAPISLDFIQEKFPRAPSGSLMFPQDKFPYPEKQGKLSRKITPSPK